MASRRVSLRVQAKVVKDARSVVDDGGVVWWKGISVNMRKSWWWMKETTQHKGFAIALSRVSTSSQYCEEEIGRVLSLHRGELRVAVRITFNFRSLNFVFYFFLRICQWFFFLWVIYFYVNVMMEEESWDVRDAYEVALLVVVWFWSNGYHGEFCS